MTTKGQVHWCEGLFLQPHHLQSMQRHILEEFTRERRLCRNYPYGVIEAKISDDQLENMRVSFERLRVIMPSGLEVNVPDSASLPSIDIKEAFAASSNPLTISVGVPVWYASRGNVIERESNEDWRVKRTYRVAEIERPDENTGENPQPILIRQINARLLLDDDDRSDLEVLPLLRIVHAAGEDIGLPRRDSEFIPPCLSIDGSPVLREMLNDIANQVMASRKELVVQINRGGFSVENMRGVQFEQMFRLRTLNHYSALLDSLIRAPSVTPFAMYLTLRQLLAELAALHPDRDQFDAAQYNHDNPIIAFSETCTKIRGLLKGAVQARFLKVAFAMDPQQNILTASLTDEALSLPNEYFLAIKTKQDPSEVARLVLDRDRFKLMPLSLKDQRIFGVQLTQELYPPVELPAQVGLHYFKLMRGESARLWERIKEERALALKWSDIQTSDFEVTLYMTIPDTER